MKKTLSKILKKFLLLFLCVTSVSNAKSQVGVNILTPHPSSALHVQSPAGTNKGLLTPTMTSVDRVSMSSGTLEPADGLIVYDKDHKMHYYFNGYTNKWVSMSPLTLSTPSNNSATYPSGFITTPASSVSTNYSVGINKQSPTQVLDVVGNATLSGNMNIGGTSNIAGNNNVNGNTNITGTLSVNGFAANALVPTGAIIMWSGTLVPVGWAICDGGTYNGMITPDLRGRFIVGMDNLPNSMDIPTGRYVAIAIAGTTPTNAPADGTTLNYGALGNKGGENGHALSLAEMPNHTHNVSTTITNNNVFGFNGNGNWGVKIGTDYSGDPQTQSAIVSETAKGSNQIHENRPPYYVLAYIIKLPY